MDSILVKKDTDNLVKKDNAMIRTRVDVPSLNAARILAAFIAQIRVDDSQLRESYMISADLIPITTCGKKYTIIKNACRDLRKSGFEAEEINLSTGKGTYITLPFFEKIKYEEGQGVIVAKFNASLTEFLINLQGRFTRYSLDEYLSLGSVYSQRIFEILSSWQGLPEVVISLEDLYRMLNVPRSFRTYGDFHRRILIPVAEEINKETNLHYKWYPVKESRAVRSIRFIFCKKCEALPARSKRKALTSRKTSQPALPLMNEAEPTNTEMALIESPKTSLLLSNLSNSAQEEGKSNG